MEGGRVGVGRVSDGEEEADKLEDVEGALPGSPRAHEFSRAVVFLRESSAEAGMPQESVPHLEAPDQSGGWEVRSYR